MRLVVDASTLVAEILRVRGRLLVQHADLQLVMAEEPWSETQHELAKRVAQIVRHGHLDSAAAEQLLNDALAVIAARVAVVPSSVYEGHFDEARSASRAIPWTRLR